MADWQDPDIKNHVKGDITKLRYAQFFQTNIFSNHPTRKFYPYLLKDMHSAQSIVYKSVDGEKRDKHMKILAERVPIYRFSNTSNFKPMQDSFYAMGQVYLYQIIYGINNLWNIMDYHDTKNPKILIPTISDITELFTNLLHELYFHNMKELTTVTAIRNAIERIIVKADIEYSLDEIVSEKMHLNRVDIVRRLKSPLITRYLARKLSLLINKRERVDDELLYKTVSDLLKRLRHYIRDNTFRSELIDS